MNLLAPQFITFLVQFLVFHDGKLRRENTATFVRFCVQHEGVDEHARGSVACVQETAYKMFFTIL